MDNPKLINIFFQQQKHKNNNNNSRTSENLAICFGPILIRSTCPTLAMMSSKLISVMISNYHEIFEKIGEVCFMQEKNKKREKKEKNS